MSSSSIPYVGTHSTFHCCYCVFASPFQKPGRTGSLEEQASETPSSSRLCTELRAIKFLGSSYATAQSTSATPRRRNCTATTLIGYIEQARLAMLGNGTSGSFGTGPASGYFLNLMFMFIVFVTSSLNHALIFIYRNVMIYALFFEIKMNHN